MKEDLVELWARWSRDLCVQRTNHAGPKVIADHDAALARTRQELERLGATDASALAGFVFATRFLSGDKTADPVSKNQLIRKLMLEAGLVAEAIANTEESLEFRAIVDQAPAQVRHAIPTADTNRAGEYSCNEKGEVWPVVTFGHTPLNERMYLQGTDPFLDDIVVKVLRVSPNGGRFQVRADGVYLARDLTQVA